MMKMIVVSNEERLHCVTIPAAPRQPGQVAIDPEYRTLVLIPGVNFCDAEDLKKCLTNPSFAGMFKMKIERHAAAECVSERVGQPILVRVRRFLRRSPCPHSPWTRPSRSSMT